MAGPREDKTGGDSALFNVVFRDGISAPPVMPVPLTMYFQA